MTQLKGLYRMVSVETSNSAGKKVIIFGEYEVSKWTYQDNTVEYEIAEGVNLSYPDLKALGELIKTEVKKVESIINPEAVRARHHQPELIQHYRKGVV